MGSSHRSQDQGRHGTTGRQHAADPDSANPARTAGSARSAPGDAPGVPGPTTDAGRNGLAALLADPAHAVVAFDFDGTLAPIVADPERARAHPGAVPALAALAPHVRSIAIITGRAALTAVEHGSLADVGGLEHLVVLGHYGAERWDAATGALSAPAPHPGVAAVRAELPELLERHAVDGAWIEDKGFAVAVHTRRATEPQTAFETLREPLGALAARHRLAVEPGRFVLELRPPGMDKGVALTRYVQEVGGTSVLYGGDDLGDLPAFAAVDKLRSDGIPGLLVCSASTETTDIAARADVVVNGPEGVVELVAGLAEAVGR